MKRDQMKTYEGRIIGTELFIPDLAKLAELYGAKGFAVTRKEELMWGNGVRELFRMQ
jgi:thiamine pyrophosphate-dependent acetolactate synthase large subunit-like protein